MGTVVSVLLPVVSSEVIHVSHCVKDKSHAVPLEQVKEQCVRIVGKLGGSVNHALVSRTDPAHLEKLAVAWDSHKHLRFDFPFQDIKPTIYFGQSSLVFLLPLRLGRSVWH